LVIRLNNKIKILVVDDDPELCNLLCQYLDKQGFSVSSVENGSELDQYLSKSVEIDLIIMDLMLPGEDGLSIIKRLHGKIHTPIIMLSACGEDVDRIIGLEIGADDYLAKPFNPRELLARIRSVLRRGSEQKVIQPENNNSYSFGPYIFNLNTQTLKRLDKKITLTCGEFSLLQIFVENPKQVLSRDNLLENLKGYDCAPFDRSIDVRIMRLRNKIETDTANPQYIHTVWGKGYQFIP